MKKLSEKKQFEKSLILRCWYSSNPSVGGEMEFGVLFLKTKTQIWIWVDDYAESIAEFSVDTPWRDIVEYALNDETFVSAVSLTDIEFLNDTPPFGKMFGFAITESQEDKSCAKLLLSLSDADLLHLELTESLYDDSLLGFLTDLSVKLDEEGIEIENMPSPRMKKNFNYEELESAFDLAVRSALKAQKETEKQIELKEAETALKLKPFDAQITSFINKWQAEHTISRYPGSSATCYMGLERAMAYITSYILKNNTFPIGEHLIPAGSDCFGSKGSEIKVNFNLSSHQKNG